MSGSLSDALVRTCEIAFARPAPPAGFVHRLVGGAASIDDAAGFFRAEYTSSLIFREALGPRLLETSAGHRARAAAWPVLYRELGSGAMERSSPFLLRKLLVALGADDDRLDWTVDRADPAVQEELAVVAELDGIGLLARALGAACRARGYPALARLLADRLLVPEPALAYFALRGEDGVTSCTQLVAVLDVVADTPAQAEAALAALTAYLDEDRPRQLCSAALAVDRNGDLSVPDQAAL